MRLSEKQAKGIHDIAESVFGNDVNVCLFGSRVDDNRAGGDVDIFIESPSPVEKPAYLAAIAGARISRLLQGRKVDVLIGAPNLAQLPIHRIAKETGIQL